MPALAVALLVQTATAVALWRLRVPAGAATALSIGCGLFAYWHRLGLSQEEPFWPQCVYCHRRIWRRSRAIQDQGPLHPGCYDLARIELVRRSQLDAPPDLP